MKRFISGLSIVAILAVGNANAVSSKTIDSDVNPHGKTKEIDVKIKSIIDGFIASLRKFSDELKELEKRYSQITDSLKQINKDLEAVLGLIENFNKERTEIIDGFKKMMDNCNSLSDNYKSSCEQRAIKQKDQDLKDMVNEQDLLVKLESVLSSAKNEVNAAKVITENDKNRLKRKIEQLERKIQIARKGKE